MNNKEINEAIYKLQELTIYLEEEYEQNGGEITEYTEHMEEEIKALETLLNTEGADPLGRWLKSEEEGITTIKDEINHLQGQIKRKQGLIDFIKTQICRIMRATNTEKIKSLRGYSFKPYDKVETTTNKDILNVLYKDKVEEMMREAHIPAYIGFNLTASATKAAECDNVPDDLFTRVETPSVKFLKPRKKSTSEE